MVGVHRVMYGMWLVKKCSDPQVCKSAPPACVQMLWLTPNQVEDMLPVAENTQPPLWFITNIVNIVFHILQLTSSCSSWKIQGSSSLANTSMPAGENRGWTQPPGGRHYTSCQKWVETCLHRHTQKRQLFLLLVLSSLRGESVREGNGNTLASIWTRMELPSRLHFFHSVFWIVVTLEWPSGDVVRVKS